MSPCFISSQKAPDVDGEYGEYYEVDNVRPINVTNYDNRMLAHAVRLKLDIIFDRWISKEQRGFVGGRSLLGNVLGVDQEMREAAYETDDGACIFFDFRAAFPSVIQEFLLGLIGMI